MGGAMQIAEFIGLIGGLAPMVAGVVLPGLRTRLDDALAALSQDTRFRVHDLRATSDKDLSTVAPELIAGGKAIVAAVDPDLEPPLLREIDFALADKRARLRCGETVIEINPDTKIFLLFGHNLSGFDILSTLDQAHGHELSIPYMHEVDGFESQEERWQRVRASRP